MPQSAVNRRLTAQDASFLYVEKPNLPMHGISLGIYDGYLSREEVSDALSRRLHLLPRYRQKLVFPPFGIATPTWEDDPDFDIKNHVGERTLPPPGDDRAMAAVAGELLVPPMDRSRPLWDVFLLQGRADGNTVILWRAHHCMVDGVSGVDISMVLHDLTPTAEPPPSPTTPWQPRPLPDALTVFQDAVRDVLTQSAANWADESFRYFRPEAAAEQAQQMTTALTTSLPYMMQPAPRTPFNGPVSNQRNCAWFECSFREVRGIRAALGGTVNDVVLTVGGGALRRYLQQHNYPVDGVELRAMCPVSMRAPEGRGTLGNAVSMMIAPLYVGIADPVERLKRVRQTMERLKSEGQAAAFYAVSEMGRNVPAPMQALAAQSDAPNTLLNTVSTNVPGPQIPLYLNGHELLRSFGLGMLSNGIGLFIAISTYNQSLVFGLVGDPRLVPDIWFIADCFEQAFGELRTAAGNAATPETVPLPHVSRRQAVAAGSAGR